MLDITTLNPTEEKLRELAALPVDLTDPLNEVQVKAAHDKRMQLREARVALTKAGKAMREDALKFQKDVIAREKELVAIVEPEEQRLAAFEDEAKRLKELEERKALLPMRRSQLEPLGGEPMTDEEVLAFDATGWQGELNRRVAAKNAAEAEAVAKQKAEQDAKQAELDAKEAALKAETEAREREEKARQDERERIEREAKEKADKEAAAAAAAAEAEAADKAKREKQERYRTWRTEQGWTSETADQFIEDVQIRSDGKGAYRVVALYKRVAEYKLDD